MTWLDFRGERSRSCGDEGVYVDAGVPVPIFLLRSNPGDCLSGNVGKTWKSHGVEKGERIVRNTTTGNPTAYLMYLLQ